MHGGAVGRTAAGVVLVLASTALAAQEPPARRALAESVVIFNTVCAQCHEAQCSGRLSFDSGYEAAVRHIVRYYEGAAGKTWLQRDLFAILDHMKRECEFYPLPAPIPPQREWSAALLQRFANLLQHDYFIPLGTLGPGEYRLSLTFEQPVSGTVQLVEASFDRVVDERLSTVATAVLPFRIAEEVQLYFRLYTDQPVALTRLVIEGGVRE